MDIEIKDGFHDLFYELLFETDFQENAIFKKENASDHNRKLAYFIIVYFVKRLLVAELVYLLFAPDRKKKRENFDRKT